MERDGYEEEFAKIEGVPAKPPNSQIEKLEAGPLIDRLVAAHCLSFGYSQGTYWYEVGVPIGKADSFRPSSNESQARLVASKLEMEYTNPLDVCRRALLEGRNWNFWHTEAAQKYIKVLPREPKRMP